MSARLYVFLVAAGVALTVGGFVAIDVYANWKGAPT